MMREWHVVAIVHVIATIIICPLTLYLLVSGLSSRDGLLLDFLTADNACLIGLVLWLFVVLHHTEEYLAQAHDARRKLAGDMGKPSRSVRARFVRSAMSHLPMNRDI